jgi:lipopolysaccharide transport system permease protein
MAWYKFIPDWSILLLPLFVVFAFITSLGPALWIAALNVKYRDFRYVIPFIIQLGLYISPVGFNSSVVPDRWRLLFSLNPMVGVIDGFRWCILGREFVPYAPGLWIGICISGVLLWGGVRQFRKLERTFADFI